MKRLWSEHEIDILVREYPEGSTPALARRLNRSIPSIHSQAWIRGLKKTPECIRRICRAATRFKKGCVPHNKGKKGWHPGGNSLKTRFRPGSRPHTWVPVGTRRDNEGILEEKISDTGTSKDWRSVHSMVWESVHGRPVPPGHIVVFKDGNRRNFRPENLECISRVENMRRNSIHNLPPELADVCRWLGVLHRHINKRKNQEGNRNEK